MFGKFFQSEQVDEISWIYCCLSLGHMGPNIRSQPFTRLHLLDSQLLLYINAEVTCLVGLIIWQISMDHKNVGEEMACNSFELIMYNELRKMILHFSISFCATITYYRREKFIYGVFMNRAIQILRVRLVFGPSRFWWRFKLFYRNVSLKSESCKPKRTIEIAPP